jgi:uncharacterized protein YcbX
MAGESLTQAELRWAGIAGDRQFGFVRVGNTTRSPWLSARALSRLVLFKPSFVDPADLRRSSVSVVMPDGERLPLDAPRLLDRLSAEAGTTLQLLQLGRGAYDSMPVSVVSSATYAAVEDVHGAPIDARRFRINVVIDSDRRETFWRGGRLLLGDADDGPALLVNGPIDRCALITIDPETAERDPSVLKTVARKFENEVGVYCATARPGLIRVGDAVRLTD